LVEIRLVVLEKSFKVKVDARQTDDGPGELINDDDDDDNNN